jgi:DNA-binding transcriptional LysR family regulator
MSTIPSINPTDLLIFYTVAREKSLSSAAEKLFLTQPAVTYHIQSLEGYARVKLLEFKKRQATLTAHGRELFKYAEGIYEKLVEAQKYIEFVREANLRIGIASVYASLVSPLLTAMSEGQDAGVKLVVKSGNSFEMVQDVLDTMLDVAIVPRYDYGSEKLRRVQVSNPEKIVCFTALQQDLPEGPLTWQELFKYPIVTGPETSVIHRVLFDKFRDEGLGEFSPVAEVGNMIWTKTMIENGKGISFTIEKDIEKDLSQGRFKLVPLKEYLEITAEALTRSDVSNPIIEKFIIMVEEAFDYVD